MIGGDRLRCFRGLGWGLEHDIAGGSRGIEVCRAAVSRCRPQNRRSPREHIVALVQRHPCQLERIARICYQDGSALDGSAGSEQQGIVLVEDPRLELPQLRAGVHAELVHQHRSHVLVGPQSFALTAGPVQGQHVLRSQALLVGVIGDQRLDLGDEIAAAP